jgi:hypothetical protein
MTGTTWSGYLPRVLGEQPRRGRQAAPPSMLVNSYAKAWLAACAVAGAGILTGVVPWPVGVALVAPLAHPSVRRRLGNLEPPTLSDRQLEHAWRTSTLAARSRMPVESRISLTAYRERLLDELLRRRLGPPDEATPTR